MKKNNLIEPDYWDPSLNHILRQMNGKPLNIHKLLAKHPKLLKAWWDFRNYSVNGGDLGRRKGELVILRVASYLNSWYEWASHVERSLQCGLALDEIIKVNKKLNETDWEESEFLLLQAVDELIKDKKISRNLYLNLMKFYSEREIMDVIAIHGMYIILGCMLNIWPIELENKIAHNIPSSVNIESFKNKLEK